MNKKLLLVAIGGLILSIPAMVHADVLPDSSQEHTSSTEPIQDNQATSTTSSTPLVIPPPVSIHLVIHSLSSTLYDKTISVSACPVSPGSEVQTTSVLCAIKQSGVTATWNWYGTDGFLDTLGGTGNDYAQNHFWDWFSDLSFGQVALNKHSLREGETILVTIGRMPLKLSLSSDTGTTGSSTIISVLQFGFDINFNPVWEPAFQSSVAIQGDAHTTSDQNYLTFTPSQEGIFSITASKEGFLPAPTTTLTITKDKIPEITSIRTGTVTTLAIPQDATQAALSFLQHSQNPDGSFGNPLITDWVAIALGGDMESSKILRAFLPTQHDSLIRATDFERRSMALQALDSDSSAMINKIVSQFDGTQIGDSSSDNDDIFGIITLIHAGYNAKDPIVARTTATLLRKQEMNGSWGNTDLTAAAIQALIEVQDVPGAKSAIMRARTYLRTHQQPDGCFGNSFTTSWVLMAINALDEQSESWNSPTGTTPLSCLKLMQGLDGGFESGRDLDTRIWATTYALPALRGDSWSTLLHYSAKPTTGQTPEPRVVPVTPPVTEITAAEPEMVATTEPLIQKPLPNDRVRTPVVQPAPTIQKTEKNTVLLNRTSASVASAVSDAQTNTFFRTIWVAVITGLQSLLTHIAGFIDHTLLARS